jgi:predicted RNA-binding Zn-ribbon protein involved in translation (DUF1610 family)
MFNCPKCGSYSIGGPRYDDGSTNGVGRESLIYTCYQCGFERRERTEDQKKATHA